MDSVDKIEEFLFKNTSRYGAFKDPLTNSYPENKEQLSAILGLLLQQNRINLNKVKLHSVDSSFTSIFTQNLSAIVDNGAVILNEFPLFTTSKKNMTKLERMTIDIAILNDDLTIFIKNKIGSSFTSERTQLKKQMEFLSNTNNKENILIFFISKESFVEGRYKKELNDALNFTDVRSFVVFWEEIFKATLDTPITKTKKEKQNILKSAKIKISIPFKFYDNSFITCSKKGGLEYIPSNENERSIYGDICKYLTEDFMQWHEKELLLHFGNNDNSLYNVNIDKMLCEGRGINFPSIELYCGDKKLNLPEISLYTRMKYPVFYNEGTTIIVSGDLEYTDAHRADKIFNISKPRHKDV